MDVEKKSGIYESNDGNDMIVDGEKYPITILVANWIRDKKYRSGLNVTFEIKEQNGRTVVTKVYPTPAGKPAAEPTIEELDRSREEYNATAAKMKTAGFGQPTPGPATSAAQAPSAAKKPADDGLPKALEGKIVSYSPAPARSFTLQSEEGFKVVISWRENQDPAMAVFRPGYKAKATYEVGDPNRLTEIVSTFKKGTGAGKGSYQPRNERLIAFLALHRDAVALFQSTTTPDSVSYEEAEDIVYERAKKTLEQAMKDFGGA